LALSAEAPFVVAPLTCLFENYSPLDFPPKERFPQSGATVFLLSKHEHFAANAFPKTKTKPGNAERMLLEKRERKKFTEKNRENATEVCNMAKALV